MKRLSTRISHLYDLNVKDNEYTPITKPSIKENQLYEKLKQILCKSQFQKLMDLLDEYGERIAQKCKFYFKKGFRHGVNFVIDSFNDINKQFSKGKVLSLAPFCTTKPFKNTLK